MGLLPIQPFIRCPNRVIFSAPSPSLETLHLHLGFVLVAPQSTKTEPDAEGVVRRILSPLKHLRNRCYRCCDRELALYNVRSSCPPKNHQIVVFVFVIKTSHRLHLQSTTPVSPLCFPCASLCALFYSHPIPTSLFLSVTELSTPATFVFFYHPCFAVVLVHLRTFRASLCAPLVIANPVLTLILFEPH